MTNWIKEIKRDMQELGHAREDLIYLIEKTRTLKDKNSRFNVRLHNISTYFKIKKSNERSQRMKEYYRKIKDKKKKYFSCK